MWSFLRYQQNKIKQETFEEVIYVYKEEKGSQNWSLRYARRDTWTTCPRLPTSVDFTVQTQYKSEYDPIC